MYVPVGMCVFLHFQVCSISTVPAVSKTLRDIFHTEIRSKYASVLGKNQELKLFYLISDATFPFKISYFLVISI